MIGTVFTKDGQALWGEITTVADGVSVHDSAKQLTTSVPTANVDRIEMDILELPTGLEPEVEEEVEEPAE